MRDRHDKTPRVGKISDHLRLIHVEGIGPLMMKDHPR